MGLPDASKSAWLFNAASTRRHDVKSWSDKSVALCGMLQVKVEGYQCTRYPDAKAKSVNAEAVAVSAFSCPHHSSR